MGTADKDVHRFPSFQSSTFPIQNAKLIHVESAMTKSLVSPVKIALITVESGPHVSRENNLPHLLVTPLMPQDTLFRFLQTFSARRCMSIRIINPISVRSCTLSTFHTFSLPIRRNDFHENAILLIRRFWKIKCRTLFSTK